MTDKIVEAFSNLLDSVVIASPKVLAGIALFALAVLIAKIAEKVLRAILMRINFDHLIARAGVDKTLKRIGIRRELNNLIPRVAYFLLLFLLAKTAADAVGLVAVSDAVSAFFGYLPNLLAALMLVVLGSAAGQFAGQAVTRAAEGVGLDMAPALGRLVSGLILFIIGIMAFGQLKIDTEIIRVVTSFALAALALAFGLSVGLGARDVIRNILAGFYARKLLRAGENIEIDGHRGVLRAITATHTQIETGKTTISLSNGSFMDQVSKQ